MKIEQNKVVSLSYKLETEGDVIETVTKEKPMQFMYGVGYLLPKFEENIQNMSTGDKFDFTLQAADAYGEWDDDAVFDLPKTVFEIDGKFDSSHVKIGENIPMQDNQGNRMYGTVEAIGDNSVTMNFNHPLAGNSLHFCGEVVDVRDATPEDLSSSCGCGCSCDDDCDCGCDCNDENCCC
ncbi:MAG: FKBP-type peptidyl-prolyl cis-trans isomerase [Prevotellaceae bacterium]|jgi:FKBP-type peptidyl-prolyl cis-trans isomerase SlyD|nr:FKBP-type peptidyl-prolyl cis-trans isomerase [Prevotellaceae bacterium]